MPDDDRVVCRVCHPVLCKRCCFVAVKVFNEETLAVEIEKPAQGPGLGSPGYLPLSCFLTSPSPTSPPSPPAPMSKTLAACNLSWSNPGTRIRLSCTASSPSTSVFTPSVMYLIDLCESIDGLSNTLYTSSVRHDVKPVVYRCTSRCETGCLPRKNGRIRPP